jgi:hypothetical protein
MIPSFLQKQNTRRGMLRNCAGFAGSALLAQLFPPSLLNAGVPALCQQAATPPTDSLGVNCGSYEPLVAILFEHRKSNSHERGRERRVRTIQ